MNAASFNKPQTGNEIINSNGHKLHFRVEGHALPNAKALIIYVPGYSGHVNRPEMFKMTGCMNRNGVVVIAVDMQGHGYSEGERCLMLNHEDLIADVIQIVDAIMNPCTTEIITFCNNLGEIKRDYLPKLQKLPFFVMGSSMGGAISSMVAQRLYANRLAYPTFSGAILCAPALSFKTPHWLLVESLR
jgi:alpha-beta hydrolase superfamily lysophospholipase